MNNTLTGVVRGKLSSHNISSSKLPRLHSLSLSSPATVAVAHWA